jgi:hypothetical protein
LAPSEQPILDTTELPHRHGELPRLAPDTGQLQPGHEPRIEHDDPALGPQMPRPHAADHGHRRSGPYSVETYSQQQAGEHFRRTWLRVLPRVGAARWYLSPSSGVPHVRVPCPRPGCGWAEKYAERTRVRDDGLERAVVSAVCLHHGEYEVVVEPTSGGYLDLATLYRNLVKELAVTGAVGTLYVMVKGGDWMPGCLLVDGALQAVGLTPGPLPARLFCPQVVTDTVRSCPSPLFVRGERPCPTVRLRGCSTPGSGRGRWLSTSTVCSV